MIDLALALARRHRYRSDPNPAVGCVIANADGRILGQGATEPVGGRHAEIVAMQDAASRGESIRGATVFVTLEPCAHHGRTPPCCDALAAAGVGRVVASLSDPNPAVAGQGFARLQAAGIEVTVGPGAQAARELNIGFFSRMVRGLPWTRLKVAASLDGTTALDNGVSQWITSEAARADGHAWRARASAVLTGVGTVLEDNPRLDARHVETPRQPTVVLVDSRLDVPTNAALFQPQRESLVYTARPDPAKQAALAVLGATVVHKPGADGKVDLAQMLKDLAQRQVNELHVEAGHKLNGSLVRENLVDEFLIYLAPVLLGKGLDMVNWGPLHRLADGLALEFVSVERVGPDLRIVARPSGRDKF